MAATLQQVENDANSLANASAKEIIRHALENHDRVAISFSGAEDVVLIDLALKIRPDVQVFTLDTGRLHYETYRFIDQVREHYGISIGVVMPDAERVQALVKEKGLFSFFKDGHKECCQLRKVAPLRGQLASLDAWITGQRQDQSPDTRADVPVLQNDEAFSTADHPLVKYNPLSEWSSERVWSYIRNNELPYNLLHTKGFVSIGCEPCTRAVLPGQHEREGRWWWEQSEHKECGLHSANG